MKYSRQRELILETVQRSDDHPTADTIYTRVRAQDPKVSLGTVYRNLNLLCENGQLLKVPIPGPATALTTRWATTPTPTARCAAA